MNPNMKFQHPRDPVQVSTECGEVLSTDSSTVTEVFSQRVGLPDSNGKRELAVSSDTLQTQAIWYKTTAGKEIQVKLDGDEIPLRPGHKITMFMGTTDHGHRAVPLAVMNHSMGQLYFVSDSLLNELGALPPRLMRLSLICIALLITFTLVWNPFAAFIAAAGYVFFRFLMHTREIKEFNRSLTLFLQNLSRSLPSVG